MLKNCCASEQQQPASSLDLSISPKAPEPFLWSPKSMLSSRSSLFVSASIHGDGLIGRASLAKKKVFSGLPPGFPTSLVQQRWGRFQTAGHRGLRGASTTKLPLKQAKQLVAGRECKFEVPGGCLKCTYLNFS